MRKWQWRCAFIVLVWLDYVCCDISKKTWKHMLDLSLLLQSRITRHTLTWLWTNLWFVRFETGFWQISQKPELVLPRLRGQSKGIKIKINKNHFWRIILYFVFWLHLPTQYKKFKLKIKWATKINHSVEGVLQSEGRVDNFILTRFICVQSARLTKNVKKNDGKGKRSHNFNFSPHSFTFFCYFWPTSCWVAYS